MPGVSENFLLKVGEMGGISALLCVLLIVVLAMVIWFIGRRIEYLVGQMDGFLLNVNNVILKLIDCLDNKNKEGKECSKEL